MSAPKAVPAVAAPVEEQKIVEPSVEATPAVAERAVVCSLLTTIYHRLPPKRRPPLRYLNLRLREQINF